MKVFKCMDWCEILQRNWLWKRLVLVEKSFLKKRNLGHMGANTWCALTLGPTVHQVLCKQLSPSILKQMQVVYIFLFYSWEKWGSHWCRHNSKPDLPVEPQTWTTSGSPLSWGTCSSSSASRFSAFAPWQTIPPLLLVLPAFPHQDLFSTIRLLYQNASNCGFLHVIVRIQA